MKITKAEFISSATKISQCPATGLPEIALIGRSNVGKSSLINALTNRKALAKTSSQPGKTRLINFYAINSTFCLVDLPGFGYAKVSHDERRTWELMVNEYFAKRDALKGALVILDPRRDAGPIEENLLDWIKERGLAYTVVFTKIDKLSKNQLSSRLSELKKEIPLESPVLFSAVSGDGKIALGKRINAMLGDADGDSGH
ncbi:MAG: YihA family ribosome biogenesis GTP-binding protein [Deltaproteobacteria bacterium]|nr:YihA family ribosome biogenesis GTP-binding protein [Deltaproteobacteria bacterium]